MTFRELNGPDAPTDAQEGSSTSAGRGGISITPRVRNIGLPRLTVSFW